MKHVVITLTFLTFNIFACSTFLIGDSGHPIIGKSYDWKTSAGALFVNKRHVSKTSIFPVPDRTPLSWRSQFGSVTFNQFGREFPVSGMNEKGLTIEILWLPNSEYPKEDSRPAVNELQWIQYNLDSFGTTQEVFANAPIIRINSVYAKVHYFVCDASADCATFEYIKGELVRHSRETLPVKAITNDTYAWSIKELKKYIGFGGSLPIPTDQDSFSRFARIAVGLLEPRSTFEAASKILDTVRAENTRWNLIYEPARLNVSFRTITKPNWKWTGTQFDYSCKSPVLMLDMEGEIADDVSQEFVEYSAEKNFDLVHRGLENLPIGFLLEKKLAQYPDSTRCEE